MAGARLRPHHLLLVAGLAALTLGVRLGSAGRLTYHEAIVAQVARELLARGGALVPTLGGRPWLEKPPLAFWLVAGLGRLAGGIDETVARLPSALGGLVLAVVVARLAARRCGPAPGMLAGLVQLTTSWAVLRGRLAEVDLLLAALVAGTLAVFEGIRAQGISRQAVKPRRKQLLYGLAPWRESLCFSLLGLTALAKGIGFGAVLVLAVVAAVLIWDRDAATARRLARPAGWALAALIALAWPLLVLARHPEAWGLWVLHVAGRLDPKAGGFAGASWGGYLVASLGQTLPWTPLALAGAWRSARRARTGRGGLDRLLWAWAVVPAALVSLAQARSAHYLIYALPPWSIWAAQGLARLGERLAARGWTPARCRRAAAGLFLLLGLGYAVGFGALRARFEPRDREWAWYASAGRAVPAAEPLVLLYDDWDRAPYPTPFGPVPHDLAVRLFYLDRPASWRFGTDSLRATTPPAPRFAVIGRDRDLPALERLGTVMEISRGPRLRARASTVDDRAFVLFRVESAPTVARALRPGPGRF